MRSTNNMDRMEEIKPQINPWVMAFIVIIPTFIVVLNGTVANVALPNIASSFGMSTDDASWVLTSYLVANAMILPCTAWFSKLLGRKKFLLTCIAVFATGSVLCGTSRSLGMLVIARVIQGLGGGAIMPISQAILLETFPHSKRGMAMSMFGMGVMVGPIVGPVLGGWITDNYSWNWIFFLNLPFSILSMALSYFFVKDPPHISNKKIDSIDYIGFSALALWLVAQQIVLDKGQKADWFQSSWVCWLAFTAFCSMVFFLIWELRCKNAIIKLKVFKNRNFITGSIIACFQTGILFGALALLPLFLQSVMKYTATLSGAVMAWRGVSCMFAILLVGYLSTKISMKAMISFGFLVLALSFVIFANLNLNIAPESIIFPNLVCGFGLGFVFTPLTTMTFETLNVQYMTDGTGVYNLIRNIGGSVGISLTNTFISDNAQVHQSYLVANLSPTSPLFQEKLKMYQDYFVAHAGNVTAAVKAGGWIYKLLVQQATLLSYTDVFKAYAVICFMIFPAAVIFKRVKKPKKHTLARKAKTVLIMYKRKFARMISFVAAI